MLSGKPISVKRSFADAVEIFQVWHCDDAVFAERPRIVKNARRAWFVVP